MGLTQALQITSQVPENSKIGDVLIFNRMDCCQRFLSPFEVWVSNAPGVPELETNVARRCGGTNVVPAEVRKLDRSNGVVCVFVCCEDEFRIVPGVCNFPRY